MDKIAETEVTLNALNTAIAYAVNFHSPRLIDLQNIQYDIYHKKEDSGNSLEKIITIKNKILAESKI